MSDEHSAIANRLLDRALAQVDTHALILLDPKGNIVGWLAGAEGVFGYKKDEIVGQSCDILFTPEDLQKDLSAWEQKAATGSPESEDDRWQVRRDGGKFWASGTLTALRDEQGQLLGFAKILRNRTDQKFHVETLESRIAFLEQSEERKNNFVSTLAHELRNPLATVLNAAQVLEQCQPASPDTAPFVQMIRRQADFMGRMIDDLLEVARTAAGKVQLHTQRIVLQELIGQAVETSRRAIDERAQLLHQLLPEVAIRVDADPIRLRQVFVNLIENAAKYTPRGGSIWIKASTEGDDAVVRVQDRGVGISPEVMPHIFELFTQAESANQSQGGLGIGLSVVKDAVALHGGTVEVISDGPGKGSEFTVRLPLPKSEQA